MNLSAVRPEERQRSGRNGSEWADTEPLCHRSEAFAEDLAPALCAGSTGRAETLPAPRRRRPATAPLLGLAMAAFSAALGR